MTNSNTTTTQNTNISQLDKANEVLKGLAINVTTEDRKAACTKLSMHRITVGQYLFGEARDLDKAMSLIEFFQNRIGDRDKKLSRTA